jgi:nucleotidyltransferase substrate binding protein (TIGR01987 family)
MWIENINVDSLLKASSKFEQFRTQAKTELEKAGVIQAFEYCFELSWKTMKRLLGERGKVVNSPREAFRMAALEGFIKDPELWFEFLKKRNLTSHTYEEAEVKKIIDSMESFSKELRDFLINIGALP